MEAVGDRLLLGDDLDLGFGACVIGNVMLGDGIMVGANAVVVKSIPQGNVTVAGIPARELK